MDSARGVWQNVTQTELRNIAARTACLFRKWREIQRSTQLANGDRKREKRKMLAKRNTTWKIEKCLLKRHDKERSVCAKNRN